MILLDGSVADGAFTDAFLALGRHQVLGHPAGPVLVLAVVAAALWLVMEWTRFGRCSTPWAATNSQPGSPERRLSSTGSPHTSSPPSWRPSAASCWPPASGRGDVSAGNGLMLDAVAAALIGHAVLGANRPNILGTVVGAVFVGVLLNGLTMLNAPYYLQDLIKGAVLIGALTVTYGLAPRRA